MHTSARLPPLSQPELISLSPVGGPVAGRTSVTLRMSADLPLVDWALLRCKFGSKGETPISGIATAPAKEGAQLNRRRVAPSAAHPYDLEVGSPTGLTLVCLSPAVDEEADETPVVTGPAVADIEPAVLGTGPAVQNMEPAVSDREHDREQ